MHEILEKVNELFREVNSGSISNMKILDSLQYIKNLVQANTLATKLVIEDDGSWSIDDGRIKKYFNKNNVITAIKVDGIINEIPDLLESAKTVPMGFCSGSIALEVLKDLANDGIARGFIDRDALLKTINKVESKYD